MRKCGPAVIKLIARREFKIHWDVPSREKLLQQVIESLARDLKATVRRGAAQPQQEPQRDRPRVVLLRGRPCGRSESPQDNPRRDHLRFRFLSHDRERKSETHPADVL